VTFEIEVGGRLRVVSVAPVGDTGPAGGRFTVSVDREPRDVDVFPTDLGLSLRDVETGRTVDVAVSDAGAGAWDVHLPRVTVTALVDARRRRRARAEVEVEGVARLVAPMPGRIAKVLVRKGDAVAARQPLVVIEAMKMENELVSPKAGIVTDVGVAEGQSVEGGRLLAVVE
jgi:biotin carboxyl carrier protein